MLILCQNPKSTNPSFILKGLRHRLPQLDLFNVLIFLFFSTLHADHLNFALFGYHLRINNLIALVLSLIFFLRFRKELVIIDRPLVISLVCLTLSVLTSLVFSNYKIRCTIFFIWYFLIILSYLLIPYFLMLRLDCEKILYLYGASFIYVGVYALSQLLFSLLGLNDPFASQKIAYEIVRPNAFAYEPSFYALYMTPYIAMCNFHFMASPQKPFFFPKNLTPLKLIFINALFFISTSASILFAYLFLCLCILLTIKRKNFIEYLLKLSGIALGIFAALSITAPFLIKKFFLKFFYTGFLAHHSFFQRWGGIKNSWKIFLENHFVGVGLGGCPSYLFEEWSRGNEKYCFFDHYLDFEQINFLKNFEPTNVATELLASLGILGAVMIAIFLGIFIYAGVKAYKQCSMSLNLLISVLVMLFVLQFNQGLFRTYIWTHLGLVYAFFEKTRRIHALNRNAQLQ